MRPLTESSTQANVSSPAKVLTPVFVCLTLLATMLVAAVTGGAAPVSAAPVASLSASNGTHSANAERLVDGITGSTPEFSWANATNQWQNAFYPMTAVLDLGSVHSLNSVQYFAGQIPYPSSARVSFAYSVSSDPNSFVPLTSASSPVYNAWSAPLPLQQQEARYIQVQFASVTSHFNLTEITVDADPAGNDDGLGDDGADGGADDGVGDGGADGGADDGVGDGGADDGADDGGQEDSHRQDSVPGSSVVRSFGFGNWPNGHLSAACIDLHDRYWVRGPLANPALGADHPENRAYPTWHPAIEQHPVTGEDCDYGHEHGTDPRQAGAVMFDYSGGWPAFGYVAETAGGSRHEDHVGHKITVAHFRAAIGNGAGPAPLYDAGFECDWLSKIHQGSFSMDAFSNHLHEYFLTLRCMDGLNANNVMDGQTLGTAFSVKVMFTYGRPNMFVEETCTSDNPATEDNDPYTDWDLETSFSSSILTGPEGQSIPTSMQPWPIGNNGPNHRAFVCSNGVIWQDMETQVQTVDIWNELIKLKRNNGDTALTIQPYYLVKNPARIIQGYNSALGEQPSQVVRTIDICYENGVRLVRAYCDDVPEQQPDWKSADSPFNGTYRAIHFKTSGLSNENGPTSWCTDAFGHEVQDTPPCNLGNIEQRASSFTNHWNDGQYNHNGIWGNVQGSLWATDPRGRTTSATPNGDGSYAGGGIGFEFIVDNRDPDDDHDGIPDGANIRGQN